MEDKITVTFDTHEPIEIDAFCKSLTALESEYSSITQNSSKLLIKEIRKGSIEIDLIPIAITTAAILPIISNVNNIIQFMDYLRKTFSWLSGKGKRPEEIKYSLKELKNIKELLQPVACSRNDNSIIRIVSKDQIDILVDKTKAIDIIEKVEPKNLIMLESNFNPILKRNYSKVLFYWYQTRFDAVRINSGNQGVVQSIDKNPKKVIFAEDESETKHQMTTTNKELNRDWQEVGYIVDLELVVNGENIVAYKILKNYPEDSIV